MTCPRIRCSRLYLQWSECPVQKSGDGSYYLILRKADSTAEQFNKVCNILSEYADIGRFTPGLDAHFAEHMETIIAEQALQKLSSLA